MGDERWESLERMSPEERKEYFRTCRMPKKQYRPQVFLAMGRKGPDRRTVEYRRASEHQSEA